MNPAVMVPSLFWYDSLSGGFGAGFAGAVDFAFNFARAEAGLVEVLVLVLWLKMLAGPDNNIAQRVKARVRRAAEFTDGRAPRTIFNNDSVPCEWDFIKGVTPSALRLGKVIDLKVRDR